MFDCESEYKKETGKEAYIEVEDRMNCNRKDTVPTSHYVGWLEEKLEASQPTVQADAMLCPECGVDMREHYSLGANGCPCGMNRTA